MVAALGTWVWHVVSQHSHNLLRPALGSLSLVERRVLKNQGGAVNDGLPRWALIPLIPAWLCRSVVSSCACDAQLQITVMIASTVCLSC